MNNETMTSFDPPIEWHTEAINRHKRGIAPLNKRNKWIKHALISLERCLIYMHSQEAKTMSTIELTEHYIELTDLSKREAILDEAKKTYDYTKVAYIVICQAFDIVKTTKPFTREMLYEVHEKIKDAKAVMSMAFECNKKILSIYKSIAPTLFN